MERSEVAKVEPEGMRSAQMMEWWSGSAAKSEPRKESGRAEPSAAMSMWEKRGMGWRLAIMGSSPKAKALAGGPNLEGSLPCLR